MSYCPCALHFTNIIINSYINFAKTKYWLLNICEVAILLELQMSDFSNLAQIFSGSGLLEDIFLNATF